MKLREVKVSLRSPSRHALLVLDSELGGQYARALLGEFEYVHIDPRPGRAGSMLFLSPAVIGRMIRRFVVSARQEISWNWKKRLLYCYFAALIDRIRPRAVLSLRGAFTLWFSQLARDYPHIAFCAVASAQVHRAHVANVRPSGAVYFVYGEYDREQLAAAAHDPACVRAAGPLLGGYFQASGLAAAEVRYDLCIPSQVVELALEPGGRGKANDRPTLLYIQRRLAEFVSRYAKERGLRVAVALRPQESSRVAGSERRFFERSMDCEVDIIPSQPDRFSTYHAIAASRVVVTHCSTTGFEVMSWPKKVLFCEFVPYGPYRLPDVLSWSVRIDDYNVFAEVLGRLLALDEREYAAQMTATAHYFNGYVAADPPHAQVARHLRHALGVRFASRPDMNAAMAARPGACRGEA